VAHSVANADRYRAAAEIVLSRQSGERVAVVVSAMSGITNGLIQAVELAASHDSSYLTRLHEFKNQHVETISGWSSARRKPARCAK
jgi:bifunctional aspartokinase / homoserine dehydrogenase 1